MAQGLLGEGYSVRGLDDLSSGSFDSDASVASDAVFLERMWCSMKLRTAAVPEGWKIRRLPTPPTCSCMADVVDVRQACTVDLILPALGGLRP